ncbi:hypothetical protein [Marinimicrobium sp. LS-A18]|uniref:hypothetical protein n=1 Tax=Marinimicrobium sp. LS-A18 TaxID=1381596 RepID=UPI0004675E4E|nr:hypothetical protein [Marinimicrobium sp. LS-A18]
MTRTLLLAISLSLVACSGDDHPSPENPRQTLSIPETTFSGEYSAEDFDLAQPVDYWEIRLGAIPGLGSDEFERLMTFDASTHEALNDTQKAILEETTVLDTGFGAQCRPLYCPVYAVSLTGFDATVIDSDALLLEFFGDIDTEAELFVYLTHTPNLSVLTPLAFEANDEGYIVHVAWDSQCLVRGENLIQVSPDGTIETLEELSQEETGVCV